MLKLSRLSLCALALVLASPLACKKDEPAKTDDGKAGDKKAKGDGESSSKKPAKGADDDKAAGDDDDKKAASEDKKGDDDKKADDDDDKKPASDDKKADDDKKGDDDGDAPKAGPRSKTPTVAEWNAADDVDVKGAKDLHCETRMVREWMRVSCRGKDDTGGAPTAVTVAKNNKAKDTLTYVATGTTSLVFPFEPGTDVEALYSWEDKSETFTAVWPDGKKMPAPLASFAASDTPGITADAAVAQHLCECWKQVQKVPTCNDLNGAPDPDCERTYKGDCEKLLECSRFEPGAAPSCLPGYTNGVPSGHCFKNCTSNADCKANEECTDEVSPSHKVCNGKD